MMLLKLKICREVWIPSSLPCIPGLVQLEGWWPPLWPSWTADEAESWMFQTSRYCLHGLWPLGTGKALWGGNPKQFHMLQEKNIWKQHESDALCMHLQTVVSDYVPQMLLSHQLYCWSPAKYAGIYCSSLKSDVFKGNIYPESSLTCDDSINRRLARKTNLLQGI